MSAADNPDIQTTFLQAEHQGIRLAIKGRFVAIALLTIIYLVTRSGQFAEILSVAAALALLGALHYCLTGSRYDRPWVKYIFITIDVALLSLSIASTPEVWELGMPPSIIFRFELFNFYFLILTVAAFSFSPGMVIWTGVLGSIAWTSTFIWVTRDMPLKLTWTDIPRDQTGVEFMEVFLKPEFAPLSSRLQEGFLLVLVALLLSIVMHRARRTVYLHLEADAERRSISDIFGQYVPQSIVDAVVADRGALAPINREATVLFVDLVGFTSLTERLGPQGIVRVLNDYFDVATQIINDHKGVVTQFQGDAILATFNVPIEDKHHAHNAFNAAKQIRERAASDRFGNEALAVRIGINTGMLIAGNVGGGGRQTYTVHGDAVNMAARLEAMNKALGTQLLISASSAALLNHDDLKEVARVEVRGLSGTHP
ncbi:MAG: adenylate/guanylate cyclase domain-containing protein, partial [Pseudomonadota bacterium]